VGPGRAVTGRQPRNEAPAEGAVADKRRPGNGLDDSAPASGKGAEVWSELERVRLDTTSATLPALAAPPPASCVTGTVREGAIQHGFM
jgi:hypothetical protein